MPVALQSNRHSFLCGCRFISRLILQIKPIKATQREGAGVAGPEKGMRRCIVVVPKQAAEGNPWSWRVDTDCFLLGNSNFYLVAVF